MYIVTHTNPDLDAILGVWFLKRYGGLEAATEIKFINTGRPDPEMLSEATAVVDTGQVLDLAKRRFDHHHLPDTQSTATCAALQVWQWLAKEGAPVEHLEPLALLAYAGDNALKEHGADFSYEMGPHALLSGYKESYKATNGTFAPDNDVYSWMSGLLDILDTWLKHQVAAQAELATKTVYKSSNGQVVVLRHASTSASFAAYEAGATLVIFEGEPIVSDGEISSYPVGISRHPEAVKPHIGNLINAIIQDSDDETLKQELESWFKHNGGFFAGRGTGKAQDPRPISIDIANLAQLVEAQCNA